ncbi:MAG: VWA domain-containing protein [Phycisphaera sp.]|nr:VWA domain-containing protein [Phycisphaera sp.]
MPTLPLLLLLPILWASPVPASETPPGEAPEAVTPLVEADEAEQEVLQELLGSLAWPRRVIAVLRLQRFDCPSSAGMLIAAIRDKHPAVRSFALLVLAHRGVKQEAGWLDAEEEPTVIRTALRCGYRIDPERLSRGVAALSRSSRLEDKLLAAELALLSEDEELHELAVELVKIVVLRMNDPQCGSLSPRLARITGGEDQRRGYKWRHWWKRNRRRPMTAARMLPSRPLPEEGAIDRTIPTPSHPNDLSTMATLPLDEFVSLAGHLEQLALQPLDLAIVIDCTASMSGEISDAQGGVDDLMRFVGDVSGGVRVAIAGYRDRREKFEKIGWDFTGSIDQARTHLWRLSAEGGGDRPELVNEGLELAYTGFAWNPAHRGVLVLVGDAPPHPGRGARCIEMARTAGRHGITTHVIGCDPSIQDDDEPSDGEPVDIADEEDVDGPNGIKKLTRRRGSRDRSAIEFFPQIAAAGGGRVVNLTRDERLVPEIAGLIVGTDFEAPMIEFFKVYMLLCR